MAEVEGDYELYKDEADKFSLLLPMVSGFFLVHFASIRIAFKILIMKMKECTHTSPSS